MIVLRHNMPDFLNLKFGISQTPLVYITPLLNASDINEAIINMKQLTKRNGKTTFFIPFVYIAQFDRPMNETVSPFQHFISQLQEIDKAYFLILDCHTYKIDGCDRVKNINPVNYLRSLLKKDCNHTTVFISPDHGALRKVIKLSSIFQKPYLSFLKQQGSKKIALAGKNNIPKLQKKRCIIIDDIINTGATLKASVDYLVEKNIENFIIYVTHVINEMALLMFLDHPQCLKIIITNSLNITINHPKLYCLRLGNS
jgi:phosphoribosylpyrophosphate synthetase